MSSAVEYRRPEDAPAHPAARKPEFRRLLISQEEVLQRAEIIFSSIEGIDDPTVTGGSF